MPRNRQDIPLETRRAELIRIARGVFLELGYHDATLAEIARRAGIAPNGVRWYFRHKDDALAAVVNSLLDNAFDTDPPPESGAGPDTARTNGTARERPAAPGWAEALADLLTAVGQLSAYRVLAPAVNERAVHSPAVAACRDRTRRLLAERVDAVVRARRLAGQGADRARAALLLVVNGELTNPLGGTHSAEVLHFVATSLLDHAPRYRVAPARASAASPPGTRTGQAAGH